MKNASKMFSVLVFAGALCVLGADDTGKPGADEINYYLPRLQKVRNSFVNKKTALLQNKDKSLMELLQNYVSKANEKYNEMRKRGNIRGVAIAGKAKRIFESALEDMEKEKSFKLDDSNREEIQAMIKNCRNEKASILSEHERKMTTLQTEGITEFSEALNELEIALPEESLVEEKFKELVASAGGDVEVSDGGSSAGSKKEAGTGIIAEKGIVSTWYPVIEYEIETYGMDVIYLPVFKPEGVHKGKHSTPLLDQPSAWQMKVINELPKRPDYAFRLLSKQEHEPIEIVEWPRKRNNWCLVVRTVSSKKVPSKQGADLYAGLPGGEMGDILKSAAVAKAGSDKTAQVDAPMVEIPVKTKPEGAIVYIDGSPWRKGRKIDTTPCNIKVTEGKHAIRLTLKGYLDKTVRDYPAKEDATIYWVFEEDPNIVMREYKVPANGRKSTGIRIKNGSRIFIEAEGKWRCGSGGELVGPEGYPNNKFFKYYLPDSGAEVVIKGVNYGALLGKIGKDGELFAIGRKKKIRAEVDGILYFEPNETDKSGARADNGGALSVSVRVEKR